VAELLLEGVKESSAEKILESTTETLHNGMLMKIQTRYFGIAPDFTRSEDLVVAFHGPQTPYALRRVEGEHPKKCDKL
jgi:hypothetical protein